MDTIGLQPLLHHAVVALRAPVQFWSQPDGSAGRDPVDGVYLGDVRVVRSWCLRVNGSDGEPLATAVDSASAVRFTTIYRDGGDADPGIRGILRRIVSPTEVDHDFVLETRAPLAAAIDIDMTADLTEIATIKAGRVVPARTTVVVGDRVTWGDGTVEASLSAPGARVSVDGDTIRLHWDVVTQAGSPARIGCRLALTDQAAVVTGIGADGPSSSLGIVGEKSGIIGKRPNDIGGGGNVGLNGPDVGDERLAQWLERASDDLMALRMSTVRAAGEPFLAAGAPWFFTLFGRDAIWAARLMVPFGLRLAAGTVRTLAAYQGRVVDAETEEEPGKIIHELRRSAVRHNDHLYLPPAYYGTIDATALWVCLTVDVWRAGVPGIDALLGPVEAALAWIRDYGDADGDGFLEYRDKSGHGLVNQGWKDSGDAIQWPDGRLAKGPIALCEVQAYAYEAAVSGAAMLEAYGRDPSPWRAWAARLANRFREAFWVSDDVGAFPAVALDAAKRPVDTATSNIGHLLGTGLLNADEQTLVARRLIAPDLNCGFGLRTMSSRARGFWPLSYHCGSVWPHDTAIAIRGLAADGFTAEAAQLAEGLLRAAPAFDYRMPELYGGDSAADVPVPVPYPAACRPQAWSAAAAFAVAAIRRSPEDRRHAGCSVLGAHVADQGHDESDSYREATEEPSHD